MGNAGIEDMVRMGWMGVPAVLGLMVCVGGAQTALSPKTMREIGRVGPRYLSYNIETVEVTGGRFWKPYKSDGTVAAAAATTDKNQPIGMDPNMFEYRAPIDLGNARLRVLARGLAPAYVRVSGTWRNSTFFQDNDAPAMAAPPDGYKGVMTRAEWKGVIDFSRAVDAELVTSVATSVGTRGADGVWTPDQARAVFDYTKKLGGTIAATEFMNEPTFAVIGGAPAGYDGAAFAKDVRVFRAFLRKESPKTVFLGPGSVGEGAPMVDGVAMPAMVSTESMLKATGPAFDAFSYHFYGGVSKRCAPSSAAPESKLAPAWFEKNLTVEAFYAKLRDEYVPGKAMWLTETGETACGGDPWAAKYLDVFRFMDQLGALAQKSVQAVMVNTLASSDYGLLDEGTLEPRPNYWAAVLWKRTMGMRVLDPGPAPNAGMRIYAQCMPGGRGGVTVLVLNVDKTAEQTLTIPVGGRRFTLSAPELLSSHVALNGVELRLSEDHALPSMEGAPVAAGVVRFAPLTVSFVEMPDAGNAACVR